MYLMRENNPAIMDFGYRVPKVSEPYQEKPDNLDSEPNSVIRGYQGGIGNSYAWELMKEYQLFDEGE